MLEVEQINKSYGTNRVLRGVDFKMKEGERIAIMGPSGLVKAHFLIVLAELINLTVVAFDSMALIYPSYQKKTYVN